MIELPSGRLIDLTDVIYVGNIKAREECFEFDIVWANRIHEKLVYEYDIKICVEDREYIKNKLISIDNTIYTTTSTQMICD